MKTIVIFATEKIDKTETFIKAHTDLLEGHIVYLNGVFFPINSQDGLYAIKEPIKIKRWLKKLGLLSCYEQFILIPQLVSYLKQVKPSVALAEYGTVAAHVYSVCKKLRIPLVIHFHGYDAHNYSILKEYSKQYRRMFNYASSIIAVSQVMRDQLIEAGASPSKIVVNPYGPNNKFLSLAPKFNELTFVSLGRFVEKKAPHKIIEAFRLLLSEHPRAKLIMAGDGLLLDRCQQLVSKYNMQKHVSFLGAITHQEVLDLYQKAYCFVQHSVVASTGDAEGTPVAVLEASAASLPVISTYHTGIQEVVQHGSTGYLVEEHNIEGMADYMKVLANDRELAKQLGENGRKRVVKYYLMERHIDTLNSLVEKATKEYI